MHQINLAGVDLNLLVVFDALMAERNVTRAASRVALTQPAASHALARLRALFKDPLFIRTPQGMAPTALALEIAGAVRAVLDQVETVLTAHRGFAPAASDRVFTIGLSDYAAFVLLPGLIERIEREAPQVRLIVRNTSHGLGLSMIEAGEVELIAGNFPDTPRHMTAELLFREDFVCAVRRDHPVVGDTLDAATYFRLRHLHVSSRGEPHGYLDQLFQSRGLRRDVGVTVGHFLIAPFMLPVTDAIATEPRRILEPLAQRLPLRLLAPPMEIPPFEVTQIWHDRYEADPGHAWLRARVREASEHPRWAETD